MHSRRVLLKREEVDQSSTVGGFLRSFEGVGDPFL